MVGGCRRLLVGLDMRAGISPPRDQVELHTGVRFRLVICCVFHSDVDRGVVAD